MKRFKIGNTVINLGDVESVDQLQFPRTQTCIFPTANCVFTPQTGCGFITPNTCGFITPNTCGFITPNTCGFITPNTCGFITPTNCGFITPTNCGFTPQTGCGHLSPVVQFDNNTEIQNPADTLKVLKDDLKTRLAEIEEQEKLLAESEAPQTLEEVEEIESQLKKALKEIGKTKNKMKK